jgi:PD-(D/E)XK nuclease superfamily protein
MLALQDAGYAVLMPFGENTRYDLVIDDGRAFSRIQCKTGRLRDGTVLFNTCSCYGHHMNPGMSRRDYHGQIDFFAVHCTDTGWVYLIPIAAVPAKSYGSLRVEPPRNNQRRNVRWAADFELTQVSLAKPDRMATEEPGGRPGAGGSCA